jgi:hypothetical protein
MNAFVIVHFGDKIKYLELEIYLSINLRKNTKYDIIYLYSINDTPKSFVTIMETYCTHTIPYDDKNITLDIKDSKSVYTHFNALRTCNFLFAYQLIQYSKICIIESDMIILNNIDSIFDLETPTILTYFNRDEMLYNNKININKSETIEECDKISKANGGIMIFRPSIIQYNLLLSNLKIIINKYCMYPNETLFMISYDYIYNLPYKYNGIKYHLNIVSTLFNVDMKIYLSILHMNSTEYKHIHIIRDNYLDDIKKKNKLLYYFINLYKNKYYKKYNNMITNKINSLL